MENFEKSSVFISSPYHIWCHHFLHTEETIIFSLSQLILPGTDWLVCLHCLRLYTRLLREILNCKFEVAVMSIYGYGSMDLWLWIHIYCNVTVWSHAAYHWNSVNHSGLSLNMGRPRSWHSITGIAYLLLATDWFSALLIFHDPKSSYQLLAKKASNFPSTSYLTQNLLWWSAGYLSKDKCTWDCCITSKPHLPTSDGEIEWASRMGQFLKYFVQW